MFERHGQYLGRFIGRWIASILRHLGNIDLSGKIRLFHIQNVLQIGHQYGLQPRLVFELLLREADQGTQLCLLRKGALRSQLDNLLASIAHEQADEDKLRFDYSPFDEVTDFLEQHDNWFGDLEERANEFRDDAGFGLKVTSDMLIAALKERLGVRVHLRADEGDGSVIRTWDADQRVLTISAHMFEQRLKFQLAHTIGLLLFDDTPGAQLFLSGDDGNVNSGGKNFIGLDLIEISSVTGDGLPGLLYAIAGEIKLHLREAPDREGFVLHRPVPPAFSVDRTGDVWLVTGKAAERAVNLDDLTVGEAADFAAKRLARIGVDDALAAAGAVAGDDVQIGDIVFTYQPAAADTEDQ